MIITKDDAAGGSWGINAYLNERFHDQLIKTPHGSMVVTSLVSMNISCLERNDASVAEREVVR